MNSNIKQYLTTMSVKLEQFIDWVGRSVSWLVLLMVVVTFLVVVLRYLFDTGWIALQESISYFHSMVFLLGAAYTLKQGGHVRVDIFYDRLSQTGKAWVDLIGHLFILMPVMIFIIWVSWPYVADSWQVMESSREAGGLPGVYLLKSLILIMAGLLMLQATAMILRILLTLTQTPPQLLDNHSSRDKEASQ
ncbi:MAG: C4-dicarboxylate ABC transporter permease [endosymbiont of Galathealinum brachiosum]|uniref:TRAP transporter small permease protein n=1 Tax=endosymbiont of Galathealinum brachiosum TaxID=2200906 RepID=A0A370DCN0_9GAMM|nr:MAG: C4-dicarboxylate ABC transporter permease [endosymbiont of Galathealinum brachiosum]